MSDVYDLLKELKNLGARIYAVDNKIKLDIKAGSLTNEISERIKYYRDDILELIGDSSERFEFVRIEKVTQQQSYAISDAQRRLWVLNQLGDGSLAYNIQGHMYLDRDIDIACFKKTIDATIERHEILRTVFKEDETGEVKQWILNKEDLGFKIDYKDFRKGKNKEEKVKEYIAADAYKAFDLEKGPLLRAGLLQVEDDSYVFYYNMHHIISDGWSMEVLSKDIFSYYDAYKENKEPALKELRIQYKDYSAWQLTQLEEEAFKTHRAYWLTSLEGKLPLLELPGTKHRPKIKTNNGYSLRAYIDGDTTGKLKKYSEANGGSIFMALLTAWNILMYRYTSQKDIIIGTPIAGREHADLEDQIGFYVNTLALRNEINPEENFNELFSRVKQNTLSAYSHQMYPFDRLVEELDLQRDTSRNAVFDVMLVLQNNGEKKKGLELKEEEINQTVDLGFSASKFDIEIVLQETGDYLSLHVIYNTEVYERDMVEDLIRHYKQLLNALVKNPGEKISEINYLSHEEKHEILVTFNNTKVDYPKDKTIVDLFEAQVKKTPDAIALVFEEKELSYKELNEQSNQLADYLQKNYAIQPDDLVGIKLERSEWTIISILGVLKAGGAYVPIDPEYPQERIEYIEKDTKCKVCIDEKELSTFRKSEKDYSKKKIKSGIKADNLAYIIYTSGTTGKPKGVMVEHGSLLNYLTWAKSTYVNGSGSFNFGLFTSLSFDLTLSSIYLPLLSGGSLSVFNSTSDIPATVKTYFQSDITCIKLTPAHISLLKDLEVKNTSIQMAIVGGDALTKTQVETLKVLNPLMRVYNEYGPTESTVGCIMAEIISTEELITIGKPISNTEIYILSEAQEIQPKRVIGEIFIGGAGLARGYLNQEALTAEKFVANPFKKGERLYKTGDLGRWLPDGNIEFLGRKDEQVKIRGYRIELGEIEHALQSHKEIEEVVVLAKKNEEGEKELVAYITAKAEQNTGELRSYLKEILPEYMLPAYYVQLEVLPLTSNGKVDKKSLPDPKGLGLASGVEYVAPRNVMEEKLAKIWKKILQRDNIGIKDDFFALGGHSLKAARLSNEYQKELAVKLSLRDLFAHTNIESHAELIRSSKKETFIQIEKVSEQPSYAISDAQRRLWVLSQFEGGSMAYNMPGMIYLSQDINTEYFKKAVDSAIERHEILRTVFKEDETGEVKQWILTKEDLGFKIDYKDFRKEDNKEGKVRGYISEDSYRAFDLEKGPLLRASLLQVENEKYVFYYNMHHIISDGWSMEVLSKDVFSYYEAYKENKQPALKELRIQYKDYSAWALAQLEQESFKSHRAYWLDSLKGELPLLDLPGTKQRPRIKTNTGRTLGTYLNKDISRKLKEYSQENGGSLFMGLLAAWNVLMHRYTSQTDIIIGTPIAGREHSDLEAQIGFYVNTLALRNEVDAEESFNTLFSKVKHSALNAYSHQLYPFDRLVEELDLQRDTSRSAVFDVLLILQNNGEKVEGSDPKYLGLKEEELQQIRDLGHATAKFDMEVGFRK